MKIFGVNACSSAFYGVKKPYCKDNVKIIPIAEDPTSSQIQSALNATKTTTKPMQGYNGYAFWLGKDLVVKKFKGDEAFSNDPYREINMLDDMFDSKLSFPNSQVGKFAFSVDGETYLVSTRVDGKNPGSVPFNKENLASLVEIITQMDMGARKSGSSKNGFSDRIRFMNYDFNGGNINLTENKAGLFDFEYSCFENIDDMIYTTIIKKNTGANCHQSDTSALPSSLRSFEFYTFCGYLNGLEGGTYDLFNDYLKVKGRYHNQMGKFYLSFAKESEFKDIAKNISTHEYTHSRLLKGDENGRVPDDILLAEAKKIQMSHFMHEQSQFSDTGKINPKQLLEYTNEATEYFASGLRKAEKSGDKDRQMYYKDCLELFSSWKRVNKTLKEKIKNENPEILRKLTSSYAVTLDSKLLSEM